jgi:chromosome segregation ATPase
MSDLECRFNNVWNCLNGLSEEIKEEISNEKLLFLDLLKIENELDMKKVELLEEFKDICSKLKMIKKDIEIKKELIERKEKMFSEIEEVL